MGNLFYIGNNTDFYYCGQCDPPYRKYYSEYHYKHHHNNDVLEKILSVSGDEIAIKSMWRMQIIGELYGINIKEYEDHTNWEYHDEVVWQASDEEEAECRHMELYDPDTYDEYFQRLAEIASIVGCERMELKCLIKSQILRYRRIKYEYEIPIKEFRTLYHRLLDCGYTSAANRLMRFHLRGMAHFAQNFTPHKEGDYIPFVDNAGKWGVTSISGNIVIEPKYDSLKNGVNCFEITFRGAVGRVDYLGNEYFDNVPPEKSVSFWWSNNDVDEKLKEYLDDYIISSAYRSRGYTARLSDRMRHINQKLDYNMLYTIAAFYDMITERKLNHDAAEQLQSNYYVRAFFSEKQIEMMTEALEDILGADIRKARSIYSEVFIAMLTEIDYRDLIACSFQYSKERYVNLSDIEHINNVKAAIKSEYMAWSDFKHPVFAGENRFLLQTACSTLTDDFWFRVKCPASLSHLLPQK